MSPGHVNVGQLFHKFGDLCERPNAFVGVQELQLDQGGEKMLRIKLAVDLYTQEVLGHDVAGRRWSFHKFAKLFERKDAMDRLVLRNKDPRGILLMKLIALVNAYARDCFGVDLNMVEAGDGK